MIMHRAPTGPPMDDPVPLSAASRTGLLRLAREAIAGYLRTERKPVPASLAIPINEEMKRHAGAFVTLHKDGMLRGCIGELDPDRPLLDVVMDHALNAAFKDPRFPPVSPDELDALHIEISALSAPVPVKSWEDIDIGRHGIILTLRRASAVFLPQVAPEQGWTLETTLRHLSVKAGLEPDAWKDPDARFLVFEATVFGE
jgi:AmmeMemoRadiSam system protein A